MTLSVLTAIWCREQGCLQIPAEQRQRWSSRDRWCQGIPGACSRYREGTVTECDASRRRQSERHDHIKVNWIWLLCLYRQLTACISMVLMPMAITWSHVLPAGMDAKQRSGCRQMFLASGFFRARYTQTRMSIMLTLTSTVLVVSSMSVWSQWNAVYYIQWTNEVNF